jgi:hypothetical protein
MALLVLAALLVLHGLLHLLGFLKSWQLAALPQMSGQTLFALTQPLSRLVGLFWVLACVLFLASAGALLSRVQSWWVVALVALGLSQLLILFAWPDAKAGTLVNLVLALPLAAAAAQLGFARQTARSVHELWSEPPAGALSSVARQELEQLPAPIQRWLEASGAVGQPRTRSVRLHQSGWLRTTPKGAWMPARAEQHFNVERPGFVWAVDARMKMVLPVSGRDSYLNGRGRMLIKLLSLVSVADASDAKTQQGTLLRFLSEMVWFPSGALSPYVHWEPFDEHSARATMSYGGASGSALFEIDARGRVANVSAERFFGAGPDSKLDHWTIPMREWSNLAGFVIPVAGDVIWKLASGDFNYYRWRVDDVTYNRAERE